MNEVVFTIEGFPAPGGSKSAFPLFKAGKYIRSVVTDAGGKRNKAWKTVVNATARSMFKSRPWTCPLEVEFHFTMPRPKKHYKGSQLREDAPGMHSHAPDCTKLIRSTEDALTGVLWADDGQICRQWASKRYGCKPGCQIVMREAA